MIKDNVIFIPIPKRINQHPKVEINGDDRTGETSESEWIKPVTIGIGTFSCRIKNAFGRFSKLYAKGNPAKFFYDNSDGTRRQFWGRIDHVKEIMDENGQFLEIKGRHRSYILSETKVNYSAVEADVADILRAIIAQLPASYGFTSNNVPASTGVKMSVEWDYISFWDCVRKICDKSRYDCRVDDDLDFHFHARNSIINYDEYIYEGINYVKTDEHGKDDYYERTRVIAMGEDDEGLLIIHTAIDSGEGTEIREVTVKSASANTVEKVRAIAEGKLAELANREAQAVFHSRYGLETLEAGENMYIAVMRQKIYECPRILQHTLRFGSKTGGVRSEVLTENEILGIEEVMEDRIRNEEESTKAENVNKLNFSLNYTFDDDNLTTSHSQTRVNDGLLLLRSDAANTGTWIGDSITADSNITKVELRYVGKDLNSSKFYYSVMGGADGTWEEFTGRKTLHFPENKGKVIKAKVELVRDGTNPEPAVNSLVFLYTGS